MCMFQKQTVVNKLHIFTLPQVKELGLLGMDCPSLAGDAQKLFDVYWYLSSPEAHIPNPWPSQYTADTSLTHPAAISINGTPALAYWAVSFLLTYFPWQHSGGLSSVAFKCHRILCFLDFPKTSLKIEGSTGH